MTQTETINIRLTREASQVLADWLIRVPVSVIPVTHPADRQALADLLFALEDGAPPASPQEIEEARAILLRHKGSWTDDGPLYSEADDT
jgi:hypothetical protein